MRCVKDPELDVIVYSGRPSDNSGLFKLLGVAYLGAVT